MAGLFDGEGSVGIYTTGGQRLHLRTQLTQNWTIPCETLLDKLMASFGGHVSKFKTLSGKKGINWSLSSQPAAEFLKKILPFLQLKKEQARLAVEWQETVKRKQTRNSKGQIEKIIPNELDLEYARKVKELKRGEKCQT